MFGFLQPICMTYTSHSYHDTSAEASQSASFGHSLSIEVLMKIVLLLELGLLLGSTLPLLVPLLCIGVSSERLLAAIGWHRGYLKAARSI